VCVVVVGVVDVWWDVGDGCVVDVIDLDLDITDSDIVD